MNEDLRARLERHAASAQRREPSDQVASEAAAWAKALKEQIAAARASQPERLAEARQKARAAREACLADPENGWASALKAIPSVDGVTGEMTGMFGIPDPFVKELWGVRLASDLLGVAGDEDAVEELLVTYSRLIKDHTHMLIVAAAALDTIATLIVPMMLDEIEKYGSNYDARVLLAQAAEKAWLRTKP